MASLQAIRASLIEFDQEMNNYLDNKAPVEQLRAELTSFKYKMQGLLTDLESEAKFEEEETSATPLTDGPPGFNFGSFTPDPTPSQQPPGSARARFANDVEVPAQVPLSGRRRRPTVSSEVIQVEDNEFHVAVVPKSAAETEQLCSSLSTSALFKHLDDRELGVVVSALSKQTYAREAVLVQEGSNNEKFYFIQSGEAVVTRGTIVQDTLSAGQCIGESDILQVQQSEVTVSVSTDDLVAWTIERNIYRNIVTGTFFKKRKLYEGFLGQLSFLKTLKAQELVQLADALQPQNFAKGEHLMSFDQEGEWLYIIVEGQVDIIGRNEAGESLLVCSFGAGTPVGELEFINYHRTVADVVATSAEVRTAKLNRKHFELCLGPAKDLLQRNADENEKYEYYRRRTRSPSGRG